MVDIDQIVVGKAGNDLVRLGRALLDGRVVAVVLDGDRALVVPAPPAGGSADPLLAMLRDGTDLPRLLDSLVAEVPVADIELLAPIARPGKIIAIGLNYTDHTAETGLAAPTEPLTFAKYSTSVIGPNDAIVVPTQVTSKVDWEAELAVVIGTACGPSRPGTLADVAAYTVANDVSARDLQFADGQWTRGKSLDTFCPLGPVLVTATGLDVSDRHIRTTVNGQTMQEASTADMIFDVAALLAFLTQGVTLEPGDVILTGTPPGVGGFREPPVYLRDGDVVEVGVEGIGVLRNPVRHVP